jgi:hypothetical protein
VEPFVDVNVPGSQNEHDVTTPPRLKRPVGHAVQPVFPTREY